ncbi:hypothetical protein [Hyalangium rubrum]|uniref:Lipoprotein n=1 Tax=Hyalangium rubrum TaxID=3103134 RepID=A0ABU5GYW7_9BACT|nr:hypothetical protein [Hyalangium sp. s54d21]MDY7226350.1 hypothetical protein [Hyalangium sp. s54d21]
MDSRFFAFNPLPTRIALFLGACVLAVLTAWALASAQQGGEPFSEARAGITAGLMLVFLYAFHRLRPRPGWGVTLGPLGVHVARPFSNAKPMELMWSQIGSIRRLGRKGSVLGLFFHEQGRVLVSRHLFPRRAVFEELASALEERVPAPRYDA